MLLETFWASLYSSMVMSITVTILVGGFYLIGRTILELLRLPEDASSSSAIAAGLASVTFFGWYAYRINIPLSFFIVCVFFVAVTLFTLTLIKIRKNNYTLGASSIYVIPLFALVFSIQVLIAFHVSNYPIGTLTNNDIFDYSILAEHLLGAPGYDNVFTSTGETAQRERIDAFGTFYVIALCAKFMGVTTLESTTIFTIFCQSLISLAIFDIVKKLFSLQNGLAFGISQLICSSSFLFFISYNNFYGQLLATFLYLNIIYSLINIEIADSENVSLNHYQSTALIIFPLLGILTAYQSAYFVYTIFSIIFCVVYIFFANTSVTGIISLTKRSRLLIPPLFIAIAISLILLPELAIWTVRRTIEVSNVSATWDWPIPLISPVYLLSIPISQEFPILNGSIIQYVFMAIGIVILSSITYLVTKKISVTIARRFIAFVMFFCFSLVVYLFAYNLKGGEYQIWKLASYIVLPICFIFYAGVALIFQHTQLFGKKAGAILMHFFLFGTLAFVITSSQDPRLRLLSNKIEQMKVIKHILLDYNIKNVVINAMSNTETMMAFNILSTNFKLFPLIKTYHQPVDVSLVNKLDIENTRVLVKSECYMPWNEHVEGNHYKIIRLDEMLSDENNNNYYYFGSGSADCPFSAFVLGNGFSGREPWGVWTNGGKASLQINIPTHLVGTGLKLVFKLQPFGVTQTGSVNTGTNSTNWDIKQTTELTVNVPSETTSQGKLTLDFNIDHPLSPKSLDSSSTDTRLLGIGFISLNIIAVD